MKVILIDEQDHPMLAGNLPGRTTLPHVVVHGGVLYTLHRQGVNDEPNIFRIADLAELADAKPVAQV